jgi:hypothetical protein
MRKRNFLTDRWKVTLTHRTRLCCKTFPFKSTKTENELKPEVLIIASQKKETSVERSTDVYAEPLRRSSKQRLSKHQGWHGRTFF